MGWAGGREARMGRGSLSPCILPDSNLPCASSRHSKQRMSVHVLMDGHTCTDMLDNGGADRFFLNVKSKGRRSQREEFRSFSAIKSHPV